MKFNIPQKADPDTITKSLTLAVFAVLSMLMFGLAVHASASTQSQEMVSLVTTV